MSKKAPSEDVVAADVCKINETFKNTSPKKNDKAKIVDPDDISVSKVYMYDGEDWFFVHHEENSDITDNKSMSDDSASTSSKKRVAAYITKKSLSKFVTELLSMVNNEEVSNYINEFVAENNLKLDSKKKIKTTKEKEVKVSTRKPSRYNIFLSEVMKKIREEMADQIKPKARMQTAIKVWKYVNDHVKVDDSTAQADVDEYVEQWFVENMPSSDEQ